METPTDLSAPSPSGDETAPAAGGGPWRRESRASLRLAAPIVAVQLGTMAMGTVDTIMLGHVSALGLASGSLGHALVMTALWSAYGIVASLETLVSQAFGARDSAAISANLARGSVLAVLLGFPLGVVFWLSGPIFHLLGQDPDVAQGAASFCRVSILSIPPFLLFAAFRLSLQAMQIVRPAFWATVVGNVVNLAANYVLVFGKLGSPAYGVAGSAASTVLARWAMLFYLLVAARRQLAPYWGGFRRSAFAREGYAILFRIGIPIGIHAGLELLVFSTVAVIMGTIGVAQLAAHYIALNLASVTFMVPLGIAGAASARVGAAIGRGDMPGARRAATVCLALGMGVMSGSALVFGLFPGWLARVYSTDPAVIAVAASLLPIAALFQVFDGCQVVATGVLRGAADTAFPAAIALLGYWGLGLPLGWLLAHRQGLGPAGLWWGLAASLALVALLLVGRIVLQFRRRIGRLGAPA